jgi:hypothetical protein
MSCSEIWLQNSNFPASRTIQFYDQKCFSATFHRYHSVALLRKFFSKKVVGFPWIHPYRSVHVIREHLKISTSRVSPELYHFCRLDRLGKASMQFCRANSTLSVPLRLLSGEFRKLEFSPYVSIDCFSAYLGVSMSVACICKWLRNFEKYLFGFYVQNWSEILSLETFCIDSSRPKENLLITIGQIFDENSRKVDLWEWQMLAYLWETKLAKTISSLNSTNAHEFTLIGDTSCNRGRNPMESPINNRK